MRFNFKRSQKREKVPPVHLPNRRDKKVVLVFVDAFVGLDKKEERRRRKTFIQKQIQHPFSLGNINIISDKNAVYEREIVLVRVQIWLPQLVVFFS